MFKQVIYYFIAVVEEGSFSKAATKYYLSQSAISQQITKLENDLGFLLFNLYPAKVMMGDTGSLLLGGAIAGIAIYLKMPLLLLIIALVPILETLSVIIQVTYFKKTGNRIFKMAPLHHHFELSGWKENKIVSVFSLVTLICCALGLIII